jgi:hypothetical protein
MIVNILLILFLLLASFSPAAKIHTKLSVEASSKAATHILVATEDISIDGQLLVLESLKGDLTRGDCLVIPEFEAFSSQEARTVECLPLIDMFRGDIPKEYVTGLRMILFLRKDSPPDSDRSIPSASNLPIWRGVGGLAAYQSAIWIEGGRSFAFYDARENERGVLAEFGDSEEVIKLRISMAIED